MINRLLNNILSKKEAVGVFVLVFLGFVFLSVIYTDLFFSPNSHLMNIKGDGLKNYFTFIYHIDHDTTTNFFEGMNFPNKELHLFTDGFYPLAAFLRLFPETSYLRTHSIGIFNSVILVSFIPALLFMYWSFVRLKIAIPLSVIGALVIGMMSPQWFRLSGHYSLALQFVIPFLIWMNLKWVSQPKRDYKLLIFSFLLVLFVVLSHPYLGVISLIFTFLYQALYVLLKRDKRNWIDVILPIVSVLLPIVVFQVMVAVLDFGLERPSNPYGLYQYMANFRTVFIPKMGQLLFTYKEIFNVEGMIEEGYAFVGTFTNFTLLFLIFKNFRRFVKKPKWPFKRKVVNVNVQIIIVVGLLFLFVSFCWLHLILGKDIVQLFGPLKQIRALGRFAWVFYYSAFVLAVYVLNSLWRYWRINKQLWFGVPVLVLAAILYTYDVADIHKYNSRVVAENKNLFDKNSDAWETREVLEVLSKIDVSQYSSILPLPYFYLGSEYIGTSGNQDLSMKYSYLLGYFSGLKNIGSCMSRTPIKYVKEHFSLFSPSYYPKADYDKQFMGDKVLVLFSKESCKEEELAVLEKCKTIYEGEGFDLKELTWGELLSYNPQEIVDSFIENKKSFSYKQGYVVSDPSLYFKVEHFDEEQIELPSMEGGGAFVVKGGKNFGVLSHLEATDGFVPGREYEVSFWYYNNYNETRQFFLLVQKMKDGSVIGWDDLTDFPSSYYINRDWTRVSQKFVFSDNVESINIVISNDRFNPLILDELLIRDSALDVYKTLGDKTLYQNNHRIESKEVLPVENYKVEKVIFKQDFSGEEELLWSYKLEVQTNEGGKFVEVGAGNVYSMNFMGNVSELGIAKTQKVQVKAIIKGVGRQLQETKLALEFKRKDGEGKLSYQPVLLPIESGLDFQEVTLSYNVYYNVSKEDEVLMYLYNPKGDVFSIANIQLSFERDVLIAE